MTKEEALRILDTIPTKGDEVDALEMAIEALEQKVDVSTNAPTETDYISRQAAIDAIENAFDRETILNRFVRKIAISAVRLLPSAQPEVIRCTECKHYREYDSEYVENAVVVQCMADRYPISETIPDGWFCAGAERRTDE